jgi:Domain of unknown function (DUF4279)
MNDRASPRSLEVQLMVDHPTLTAVELISILKLSADQCWDVGQHYKPSPYTPEQRYTFSRWAIQTTVETLDNLAEAIDDLLQRIQGVEKNFLLLPHDSTVSLTLFVTETDSVIGMGLDAKVIDLLARINAGIEISLVVTTAK